MSTLPLKAQPLTKRKTWNALAGRSLRQAPNLFCMKLKILKTLADDCLKFLKPKTAKPPQEPQNPNSTEEEQLREALLLIQAEENSGPTAHRHWGLNE